MCSVCGICDFNFKSMSFKENAEKMSKTMKNRGPDSEGIRYDLNCALAHNRLAVMDISGGAQPMSADFEGKTYTIVYNGEIYNCDELCPILRKNGIELKTKCDTEVVLWTYILFGKKSVELLNGIFAFAVYCETDRTLFLARDRFGVKPLFYAFSGSTLMFASEIKAILESGLVPPEIDKTGLWQLLFMSPVTVSGSGIFKNIFEIKPAHFATFDENGFKTERYWSLKAEPYTKNSAEAAEEVKYLLTDAITRQLKSDVPICTFLSGGIDSSIISAVAAKEFEKNGDTLCTYSFEYDGNKTNFKSSLFQPQGDDDYAVFMAKYIKSDHTVLTCPTDLNAIHLLSAVLSRDFPGQADIDSSLYYFCGKVKKKHTVALSGECADEIFGGYPWFYRSEMLKRSFFPWIHAPFARANLFRSEIAMPKEGYDWASGIYKKTLDDVSYLESDSEDMKTSRKATRLSQDYFMASLLERKDRMSMAHGLEVRVPFADHRISELVYNIPREIKFENGVEKALLRNAMKDYLPEPILRRKKSPYPKTHNPSYERAVRDMLGARLAKKGFLFEYGDLNAIKNMLTADNVTWFGQLMGRPQLIAWLVQLDYWAEIYNVKLV